MWLIMATFCVCVCACVHASGLTLHQCHPPLFHVAETVYDTVVLYTRLVFVVLGYLAKMFAR
jgi:hypothetical protein